MLNISKLLFREWNDSGLRYCHWKSNEHLVAGLDGDTDLDILLSSKDKQQGEEIMRLMNMLKCKSAYGASYPDVDDWIGFDLESGCMIHVHLHYKMITGHKGLKEYDLPWTQLALDTRIFNADCGVYTINPNLEMLTLYTRIGLKVSIKDLLKIQKGIYKFSPNTQKEIDWLKDRISWIEVQKLLEEYYRDSTDVVLSIMKKESLMGKEIKSLRLIAEKNFASFNREGRYVRVKEFYYTFVYPYIKLFKKKYDPSYIHKKTPQLGKGVSIAFLGQDGAGKTTVTADIIKWLKWKMDAKYAYLGSGDNYHSWRKSLIRILPNNIITKPLRILLQITRVSTHAKDVLKTIENGEKYVENGGIVVFDRYPQVRYAAINDGPKLRMKLFPKLGRISKLFANYAKIEEKYLAKASEHHPNIVFKLVLPPEESVRRKPENDLESMKLKHNIINSLEFQKSNVYTIDATMPYNDEIILIKNIIWQHIHK